MTEKPIGIPLAQIGGKETAASLGNDIRTRSQEFPQNREGQANALLSILNIGPKAAILLLLPHRKDTYLPNADIVESFKKVYKSTEFSDVHHTTSRGYCDTLCNVGLVAQKYTIDSFGKEESVGYGLTEAGRKFRDLAAFRLHFENKNKISLFTAFGSTQTSSVTGNHAPHIRARILKLLAAADKPLREADICEQLEIKQVNAGHSLKALKMANVIEYQSVTPATQVAYAHGNFGVELQQPQKKFGKELFDKVAVACRELANESLAITQANVFEKVPEDIKSRWSEKPLRDNIPTILSHLARQGFLKRGQFKGGETQSQTQINEKGRVANKFSEIFLKFLDGDEKTVKWIKNEILPNVTNDLYRYIAGSIELYYPYSMAAKMRSAVQNRAKIIELIVAIPGINIPNLFTQLNLNEQRIRTHLLQALNQREVYRERVNGVYGWYPAK